jgi:PilZ domain
MILPSSLVTLSPGGGLRLSSTARVGRGPSEGARSASKEDIGGHPLSPLLMGNSPQPPTAVRLCSTMEQTRPYQRSLYRLPVTYPVMYCVLSIVGEGTITNLSAVGCTIETDQPLLADQNVALRLLLPDQRESLPIDEAQVRWVHGNLAGIEFVQVEPTANLRLHGFVWDQMVQRVRTIQQHRATS